MTDKNEVEFSKYKTRGPDYHYKQIDKLDVRKFNSFTYGRYMKHVRILEEYLRKLDFENREVRILDVGCGDGVLLFLIEAYFKDVKFDIYGVDASSEALAVAKKKLDGNFSEKNVYKTDLEGNFFDVVISSDVIEHVNSADKMLEEIKRISKNEALIVIGTPIRVTEEPLDKMHVREFYPNEFKQLCEKHFCVLDLKKSHNLLFHLLYEKKFSILGKKIAIFRYLMNLSTCFGSNPFEKTGRCENERFSYMFVVCVNNLLKLTENR